MSETRQPTVTTAEARDNFSDLLNRAAYGKERVVLTRRGRALAALVPLDDVALLEAIEDRDDIADARAARAEADRDGTLPWEKVKADLGL